MSDQLMFGQQGTHAAGSPGAASQSTASHSKAWVRFFIALAGLGLAFFLATFSNVLREQGNLWGMTISASLALLLAGAVAVTVVPYLARRVRIGRIRYRVEYEVTREGAAYLALVLVIGIAALNTGNNLLFIIVAAMLSAVIVSGLVSFVTLSGLRLEVSLPQHVFAKEPVMGKITLHNSGWLPRFSVSVTPPREQKPRKVWRLERARFAFPPHRPAGQQWVNLPDLAVRKVLQEFPAHKIIEQPAYFAFLPARAGASVEVELNFARRGRYVQDTFGVSTRFPFSFLRKTRRARLEREVMVYPSVQPTHEFFELLPMITGEFAAFAQGRGHDLYRIRDYAPGDAARYLDWKATARSGGLKVREFAREDERKLRIVFDNPPPGILTSERYEEGVSLAASFAWHFADGATEISFAAPGFSGGREATEFLRHLAMLEPAAGPSILEGLEGSDAYNIVVTSRPRGSISTSLWATSYFIFLGDKQ